jgi:hypothetical protein
VVAGPVHVQPTRPASAAKKPSEGRP